MNNICYQFITQCITFILITQNLNQNITLFTFTIVGIF